MKKFTKTLILAAVAAVMMAPLSAADKKNAVDELKARGTFVLGLDASFPPLGFTDDDGSIVGYDIDLAKEVARRLGVAFKAQPID